ncbi:hypothetical protein, partial [Stenotrophomonas maltophilia]|uniref:hypothetical protein n=1 Tax=Stenotrophomonas maltophilia TaxID=40324 RepID=UPI001955890E
TRPASDSFRVRPPRNGTREQRQKRVASLEASITDQRAAVGSAFKRAEHRRSGEGEEVRVSERSEFPHRSSTDRGAQGTDAQHRLAAGGAFLLVTFLFARKEK